MSYENIPFGTPEKFNVVVEIQKGGQVKYEYDEEWHEIKVSAIFRNGFSFPFDYGYVPKTRGGDGDHLDVFVLGSQSVQIGVVVECRAIGMIELINWSEKREKLLNEYIDFCLTDTGISKVVKDFNITKKDIKEIYNQLLASGAGQWQGGHYVALSTLAYAQPLEYFLKAKKIHKSDLEIMYNLTVYFEKGMNQNLLKEQLVERVKKSRGFWEKFWKSME